MTTILRNDKLINTRRRLGVTISFVGMGVLIGGFVLTLVNQEDTTFTTIAFISLPLGWLLSQVGLYLANRYVRAPRPDQRIDEGMNKLGKAGRNLRVYHYFLPVPHVILSPSGVIAVIAKYQGGDIVADGAKWKQTGVGFFRRFFGQESLGNPTLEAENAIKQLAGFIGRVAPDLAEQELPLGAMIVFTAKGGGHLDLNKSIFPALHFTKLTGFWKQRQQDPVMDDDTFQKLQVAFDQVAVEKSGFDLEDLEES
ncbi:MAG: hypothetical protein QNJ45_19890 [Ardenticatenaceae bacterium]|nr:hypothetical protein [Ardenticatenaceae bacterium]